MLIIAGLGNPGRQYAGNRHNVGFLAADRIHARHRFSPWRVRFQAETAEGTLRGRKVLLMKPMTYMNESGRAVGEAAGFFKVPPADLVVIHDELDLPPGKLRMKTGGGHGGHNGLRSVTQQMSDAYRRMRIGIGHPGARELVHSYVLHDFAKADADWLEPLLDAIADNAPLLADGADATFGNKVHLATTPERKAKPGLAPTVGVAKSRGAAEPAAKAPADVAQGGPLATGLRKLLGRE